MPQEPRALSRELTRDFEETLARWDVTYAERPRQHLEALLLLALEREQIVTTAYRDEVMAERLSRSELPTSIRQLFQHSLGWAWHDEAMHTTYTRGLLLRIGGPRVRLLTWFTQMAGALAGWAAAVQHHAEVKRAPISRLIASLVVLAGRVAGKVPRAMSRKLRNLGLREYCQLQVDAEESAALGWGRAAQLATAVPRLPARASEWFLHMREDERRHGQIFSALARALDEEDRVQVSAETLVARVREIGELFLPRELRSSHYARHPLGSGGRVVVRRSPPEEDKREALGRVLESAGIDAVLSEATARTGRAAGELTVVIKTSFMLGYRRDVHANRVDPELLDELARALRRRGVGTVRVAECGNLYDRFFDGRSVEEVAAYFGYTSDAYTLLNLEKDQVPHVFARGMGQSTISKTWRDAEVRIVFAKACSHPVDLTHLTIAAAAGVGERFDDFLFAERFTDQDTAMLMQIADYPPELALIDAFDSAADGMVGQMGCPRPPVPRRLYAGRDALAVDLVATRHMGIPDPTQSRLLKTAIDWFGDPRERAQLDGIGDPIPDFRSPYATELHSLLSLMAIPVWQFASGRGAAFLPAMDPEVFPPREGRGQGPFWRAYRWVMRGLLGLGR